MMRTIGLSLGLLSLLAGAACFNTNAIVNGGMVCGSNDACPSGFTCNKDNGPPGHCWRDGTGAPCTVATSPYGPFTSSCSTSVAYQGSYCDPVCQSGCPCGQRCILDKSNQSATTFVCEGASPLATSSFISPLGNCDQPKVNACAPGSVCIGDNLCPNLCYRTCRQDADCGTGSQCTQAVMDGAPKDLFLCSPPIESCNPIGASPACATGRDNFACVLMAGLTGAGTGDLTTCDCVSLHDKAVGTSCSTGPDDCVPGAACVGGICHLLCSLKGTASGCAPGRTCAPVFNSSQFGTCS